MDTEVIELEDKKNYAIIDEKQKGDITYLFLQDVSDYNNICIRKKIIHNNNSYIVKLVDEKELQSAMKLFS